jgi:hypothetical protein
MDPNTKLILDELHKGFSNEQVGHLESAAAVFDEGKPRIEAFVEDVKLEVGKLSHHWDRSVRDITNTGPGIIPNPKSVTERPPALDGSADGSDGHCDTNCYRDWEGGFGSVYVQTHLLIKGTYHSNLPTPHGFKQFQGHISDYPRSSTEYPCEFR